MRRAVYFVGDPLFERGSANSAGWLRSSAWGCIGLTGQVLAWAGPVGAKPFKRLLPHAPSSNVLTSSAGRSNRYTPPRSATVWGSAPISPSIVTASSPTGPRGFAGDLLALLFDEGRDCAAEGYGYGWALAQALPSAVPVATLWPLPRGRPPPILFPGSKGLPCFAGRQARMRRSVFQQCTIVSV